MQTQPLRTNELMEQKENDTTFKANISDEKSVTYFKSIFYDPPNNCKLPEHNAETGLLDFVVTKEEHNAETGLLDFVITKEEHDAETGLLDFVVTGLLDFVITKEEHNCRNRTTRLRSN